MTKKTWIYHALRLATGLILALLVGWSFERPFTFVIIFLMSYLAWQFYNAVRLYQWLQNWETEPPESLGMWAEIFDWIAALQKQNIKRSRQYQSVIDDFEGLTDAFPDATLVIDSNDVIRWFNDSAIQLLALKPESDRGQAVTNLIREPAFSEWLAVQHRFPGKLEVPCPANDNVILQINAVRFRKNQRLLILRDVTDVQNLERMRRDLVANVSHELRTPLTVLLGYLELLQAEPDKPDPKAVNRMYKQASQMHALLDDLLELSRLEDTEPQDGSVDVDIPSLLAQLEEQAAEYAQDGQRITFSIQAGLHLRGIPMDLSSAFQNLIVNAIRYTPSPGDIQVNWIERQDGLVFSVTDSGVGIPHRDIPRITERFYRVGTDRNRETGGTGLGLAIVKHVLNSHGAKLEVASVLGEGSEFCCVFPLSRKISAPTA